MLNSDDRYHGLDHAHDVDELNRYLARIQPRHSVADQSDLSAYRVLRDTTRALLLTPGPEIFFTLNELARQHPLTVWFDELGAPGLRRVSGGEQDSPLGVLVVSVLAAVHDGMLTGHWARLRACRRFDCSWIYYDGSPNGSMRWCTTDPCGNVMKTRAYRARLARNRPVKALAD
ncbi:hypothetical protein ASG94_17410 [Nocardioides sp. Soil805]|nr:hypothetical protein ASG94_17410 [Nocardioides sp. Soil805]